MAASLDWHWFTNLEVGLGRGSVLLAGFRKMLNFRGPPHASGWKRMMNLSVSLIWSGEAIGNEGPTTWDRIHAKQVSSGAELHHSTETLCWHLHNPCGPRCDMKVPFIRRSPPISSWESNFPQWFWVRRSTALLRPIPHYENCLYICKKANPWYLSRAYLPKKKPGPEQKLSGDRGHSPSLRTLCQCLIISIVKTLWLI